MKDRIIFMDTSTALCTAALSENGRIVSSRRSEEPRAHASLTAPFIKEMLDERGLRVRDCDAVCVSKGPGSYTGLRVGVSTAKGLCFGAGIPLIGVGTLDTLVWQAIECSMVPEGCKAIVPMIDARRMEVYTAVFSPEGKQLTPTEAKIIDSETFASCLGEGPVLFIGDGALKCREVIDSQNAVFVQCFPQAGYMLHPAMEAFEEKRFEDVAYFEPFYLKEFIATTPKHRIF